LTGEEKYQIKQEIHLADLERRHLERAAYLQNMATLAKKRADVHNAIFYYEQTLELRK
jgi:hypothetical protein